VGYCCQPQITARPFSLEKSHRSTAKEQTALPRFLLDSVCCLEIALDTLPLRLGVRRERCRAFPPHIVAPAICRRCIHKAVKSGYFCKQAIQIRCQRVDAVVGG
jgi:hypothetical protein